MPSYLSFARFYDGLMQDACYEKRCDYILKLAESFGHDMGITLDLACGTGTLTRLLKKRGVDVFGIDYSMEMLKTNLFNGLCRWQLAQSESGNKA